MTIVEIVKYKSTNTKELTLLGYKLLTGTENLPPHVVIFQQKHNLDTKTSLFRVIVGTNLNTLGPERTTMYLMIFPRQFENLTIWVHYSPLEQQW